MIFKVNYNSVKINFFNKKPYIKGWYDNKHLLGDILDKQYWNSNTIIVRINDCEHLFTVKSIGLTHDNNKIRFNDEYFKGEFCLDKIDNKDIFYFNSLWILDENIINHLKE
jgi:hypothetical protein